MNPLRYNAFRCKCFSGFSKVALSDSSSSPLVISSSNYSSSSLALNSAGNIKIAETSAGALPLPLSTICLIYPTLYLF
jgi:hypothetical protein